ncbi:phospholipase A and acyltransferase 2-like isoform X1 [Megalobrama amblycephala]|uniref:phospholipase A and acyltransferase 2-like isoform X1 n=1 Tax=Megalobrama amblycephala TaxID=75352 RepID=UPI00201418B0|nr:phospholipase A and acyltransferase 2-like isoform X1 [Megalobrama amblycephala]
MKSLSVKLVLVTVLLQLCLSVLEVNAGGGAGARPAAAGVAVPNFGDLIKFPRTGYSHYGIFVGDGNVPLNGRGDHNIFEMTRKPPGCRFSTHAGPFIVGNKHYNDTVPQTPEQMVATIEALMRPEDKWCKKYSLRKENCEHIATLVRYGRAMCRQEGNAAAGLAGWANSRVKQKRREASAAA